MFPNESVEVRVVLFRDVVRSWSLPLKKALTPKFPFRAFRFNEPFSNRLPADKFTLPLMPCTLLSFKIIFMIHACRLLVFTKVRIAPLIQPGKRNPTS